MTNKMKKINLKKLASLMLVGMMSMGCGCSALGGNEKAEGNNLPGYTQDEYDFMTIFTDGKQKTLKQYNPLVIEENGKETYHVYSNIGTKNYLKMELETDVNLVGYINYFSNDNASITHSEKFYVEAGSQDFITFLDAFRDGAYGAFPKTISTITFQNVDDTKEGTFTLKSIGVNDREIVTREELRITDGATVLGTSAFYGGCISYLERTDQDVYEYLDSDGNMCINRDVDPEVVYKVRSDSVNLVNICDLGREIQPSYYSAVGPENGYDPVYQPGDAYQGLTMKPVYNPIQCGDYGGHSPQIIDYNYQSNFLYIKMKAQEWFFKSNVQANGYIEVTYYFHDGAVIVDNRYIDFSQFINEREVAMHMQETPATYFAYPLNYFYCETKQGVIFDKNCSSQNGRSQEKTSLKASVSGPYFYSIKGKMVTDGWCAFVNEEKFGVGILMPNADRYVASRGEISTNYFNEKENTRYYKEFFSFDESKEMIPSYAAINYSYINPSILRKMVNFVPLEYKYALFVGTTEEMSATFDGLKKDGVVTNDNLLDKENGWPVA